MPIQDVPQVGKTHAVPQNVMDVEFKLIGDMTLRQFAYLLVCGIIAYVSFTTVVGIFKWPLVIIFTLLGVGLAFVPIQERGLDEWIINFIQAMFMPTQRVWKKEPMIPQAFLYQSMDVVKQELITLAPTTSRRKLEKYLDYGVEEEEKDPLDIPEAEYIMKVKRAFSVPSYASRKQRDVSLTASPRTVSGPSVIVEEEPELGEPVSEPKDFSSDENKDVIEPSPESFDTVDQDNKPKEQEQPMSESQPQEQERSDQTPTEELPKEEVTPSPEIPLDTSHQQEYEQKETPVIPVYPDETLPQAPQETPVQEEYEKRPISDNEFVSVNLMTPDQHSGRRFTQLLPSEGEIILPIRGEKILRTTAQQEVDSDVQEKAQKLQMLLDQIKRGGRMTDVPKVQQEQEIVEEAKPVTPAPKLEAPPIPEEHRIGVEAKEAAERLKDENQQLSSEIDRLKSEINQSQGPDVSEKENLLHQLEMQRQKAQSDYERLHKQISELQERLKQKQSGVIEDKEPVNIKDYKVAAKHLTTIPNILSGIVRDAEGTLLEGILLIVKDNRGDPVRAFKTNRLGEFVLATPLENGLYTVEVSAVNDTSLSFDIISIEAKGEVIPPVEIVGS